MCSRETCRLPAAEVIRRLRNCSMDLPLEIRKPASALNAKGKFVVYVIEPQEPHAIPNATLSRFILVEVNGTMETVLDQGTCEPLGYRTGTNNPYMYFMGRGERLDGCYEFYATAAATAA
ncbi:MAG: hypothetical protein WC518_02225 [Patescibacteria group bacterium]